MNLREHNQRNVAQALASIVQRRHPDLTPHLGVPFDALALELRGDQMLSSSHARYPAVAEPLDGGHLIPLTTEGPEDASGLDRGIA